MTVTVATSPNTARLAYSNIIADSIDGLARFYSTVFGFTEIMTHRSPIYRCLDAGGHELGFNARAAYALLSLTDREAPHAGLGVLPLRAYFTFELTSRDAVDATCLAVTANGGRVLKEPYETYYNAWQAVLEDPEGNVFRANHRMGPRTPASMEENASAKD